MGKKDVPNFEEMCVVKIYSPRYEGKLLATGYVKNITIDFNELVGKYCDTDDKLTVELVNVEIINKSQFDDSWSHYMVEFEDGRVIDRCIFDFNDDRGDSGKLRLILYMDDRKKTIEVLNKIIFYSF